MSGPAIKTVGFCFTFHGRQKQFFVTKSKEVAEVRRTLRNEEIYNLHSFPTVIRAVRWAKHVRSRRVQNFFKTLVPEPEGKRPLERPCSKWEDNKIGSKEIGYEGMDWIYVV